MRAPRLTLERLRLHHGQHVDRERPKGLGENELDETIRSGTPWRLAIGQTCVGAAAAAQNLRYAYKIRAHFSVSDSCIWANRYEGNLEIAAHSISGCSA